MEHPPRTLSHTKEQDTYSLNSHCKPLCLRHAGLGPWRSRPLSAGTVWLSRLQRCCSCSFEEKFEQFSACNLLKIFCLHGWLFLHAEDIPLVLWPMFCSVLMLWRIPWCHYHCLFPKLTWETWTEKVLSEKIPSVRDSRTRFTSVILFFW